MKKLSVLLLFSMFFYTAKAQKKLKVLFLGNSYTEVNNLPETIKQLALADGNIMNYDRNTPGGYTFSMHAIDQTSLNLIQKGDWDYVVLQEQSQLPSFPQSQVNAAFFPYVVELDSLVHAYNPCAKTVFYVTWGRKNGDAQNGAGFPPVSTYEGMDSMLTLRYTQAAQITNAYLSPVGPLWRELRKTQSAIELYQPDESHPSVAGTYAAACAFYAVLFGEDVRNNAYTSTLSATDADAIKVTAQLLVKDSLRYWRRFNPMVEAVFEVDSIDGNKAYFSNLSQSADSYFWNFGDGHTDSSANPGNHEYDTAGQFVIKLTAIKGCDTVTMFDTINIQMGGNSGGNTSGIAGKHFNHVQIYPNPASHSITIKGISSRMEYTIYDMMGRNVQKGIVHGASTISVRNLTQGSYFIKLQKAEAWQVLKFLKL